MCEDCEERVNLSFVTCAIHQSFCMRHPVDSVRHEEVRSHSHAHKLLLYSPSISVHHCVLQLHQKEESHVHTLLDRPVGAVFSTDRHRCEWS